MLQKDCEKANMTESGSQAVIIKITACSAQGITSNDNGHRE